MSQAKVIKASQNALATASAALVAEEVVGLPTETVYGLAGRISSDAAIAAIFAAKRRPAFDPLIVHVATSNISELVGQGVLTNLTPRQQSVAESLIRNFWPGPLTLVLPRGPAVSDLITSGQPTVALRMPANEFFLELIRQVGPLAAPSANTFSHVSPSTAAHVAEDLGAAIPLIIDGGDCAIGLESTIVRVNDSGDLVALRLGGLELETISDAIDAPVISLRNAAGVTTPGQLLRHYSPNVATTLVHELPSALDTPLTTAVIEPVYTAEGAKLTSLYFPLCKDGSSQTAARNLFGILRKVEQPAVQNLLIKLPTNFDGLWPAISDRLTRAAHRD